MHWIFTSDYLRTILTISLLFFLGCEPSSDNGGADDTKEIDFNKTISWIGELQNQTLIIVTSEDSIWFLKDNALSKYEGQSMLDIIDFLVIGNDTYLTNNGGNLLRINAQKQGDLIDLGNINGRNYIIRYDEWGQKIYHITKGTAPNANPNISMANLSYTSKTDFSNYTINHGIPEGVVANVLEATFSSWGKMFVFKLRNLNTNYLYFDYEGGDTTIIVSDYSNGQPVFFENDSTLWFSTGRATPNGFIPVQYLPEGTAIVAVKEVKKQIILESDSEIAVYRYGITGSTINLLKKQSWLANQFEYVGSSIDHVYLQQVNSNNIFIYKLEN